MESAKNVEDKKSRRMQGTRVSQFGTIKKEKVKKKVQSSVSDCYTIIIIFT